MVYLFSCFSSHLLSYFLFLFLPRFFFLFSFFFWFPCFLFLIHHSTSMHSNKDTTQFAPMKPLGFPSKELVSPAGRYMTKQFTLWKKHLHANTGLGLNVKPFNASSSKSKVNTIYIYIYIYLLFFNFYSHPSLSAYRLSLSLSRENVDSLYILYMSFSDPQ